MADETREPNPGEIAPEHDPDEVAQQAKAADEVPEDLRAHAELVKDLQKQVGMWGITDAIRSLNTMRPTLTVPIKPLSPEVLRAVVGPRPEIALLRQVHAELEAMSALLAETGQQTADMANVTKANLTALGAVLEELQESRKAANRFGRIIVALTIALLLVGAVAAVAVGPAFVSELGAAWSWVQSPH